MVRRFSLASLFAVLALAACASTASAQQIHLSGIDWQSVQQATAAVPSSQADPAAADKEQKAPQAPDSTKQAPANPEKRFIQRILADQKAIWASPLKLRRSDAAWLVPLTAATVVALRTDTRVQSRLGNSDRLLLSSNRVSRLGSGYSTFGAAGAIYLVGRLAQNDRATETGALGIEALINSSIVAGALKFATGRERPGVLDGDGSFGERGKSFPSGHAATIWALSTVVAEQYRDKPVIRIAAYGVATAVSISRVTGRNHFPSDVLVGSTIGYLIGRYTVRRHSNARGGHTGPVISPYFNPAGHSYGIRAYFSF